MTSTPASLPPPATFRARLRERLRADILDGRLKVHAQLPSESELTALFGVSRITVRQALEDLRQQGLVVKLQGKGTFVARPSAVSASFDHAEGLSEATTPSGRVVVNRRLALATVRAPSGVAGELGLDAGTPVTRLDTLRYVDGVPLSINRSWMRRSLGMRIVRLDLSRRDLVEVIENELRQPVSSARTEIHAVHASAVQARRLRVKVGLPCLRVHRVLLSPADEALHYEVAVYRGDLYTYRSAMRRSPDRAF